MLLKAGAKGSEVKIFLYDFSQQASLRKPGCAFKLINQDDLVRAKVLLDGLVVCALDKNPSFNSLWAECPALPRAPERMMICSNGVSKCIINININSLNTTPTTSAQGDLNSVFGKLVSPKLASLILLFKLILKEFARQLKT
eukprot:g52690.t1